MQCKATTMILSAGLIALVVSIASYSQQHDHAAQPKQANTSAADQKDIDIFCSTMKTGQLCTHGTANNLGLSGQKQEQWTEFARKYNKAVDAATLQLFKDAEGVLTPAQLTQLKAWFAVGLNPQINQILYSKGLGPQKH
jgi:N-acetylglutamate synthase/N-acetylornithine aminotransferase